MQSQRLEQAAGSRVCRTVLQVECSGFCGFQTLSHCDSLKIYHLDKSTYSFFFSVFKKNRAQLLYNAVLASAVQQSESALCSSLMLEM